MLGYYSPDRWERTNNPEDLAGEISFNPDSFESRQLRMFYPPWRTKWPRYQHHHFGTPAERDTTTSSGEPRWNP